MSLNIPAMTPSPIKKVVPALIVATLFIGCLFIIPVASAEDANSDAVPAPKIDMTHEFGVTVDDVTTGNEVWKMDVSDGDVTILLLARNLTDMRTGLSWIDYQSDINYHVGDNTYIAQITMAQINFLIDGHTVSSYLDTCDDIVMTYTPVEYDGALPTFYCNITYSGIDLQQSGPVESTFDLTLSHHITVNWTQTDIKVEAKFDLSNMKLLDPDTGNEFAAGTPFAIELPYIMMLTLPNSHGEPITPSGHTDTSLEYDLTTSSGAPITVSKLTMNNNFTVTNETGSYASIGYSSMQYGAQSQVTHGFPNLVYGDTVSVESDPQITVYHDSIGGVFGSLPSNITMIVIGIVLIAVAAVCVLFVVKRRRKAGK